MKNKDELMNIKSEVEKLGKKLAELSSEELEFVTGGKRLIGSPEVPDSLGGIVAVNPDEIVVAAPGRENLMGEQDIVF